MNKFVWTNPYLPQTLQIPMFIGYFNFVVALLFGFATGIGADFLWLLMLFAAALGSFGIANVRWWGYLLSLGATALPFVFIAFYFIMGGRDLSVLFGGNILNTIFRVAIIVALLHPMSTTYVKTRFEKTIP